MNKRIKNLLALAVLPALFFSCSSDNDNSEVRNPADETYVLSYQTTDWEMNFIGPASITDIKLAGDLGLTQQIAWKGTLTYADVANQMQQADALVHFSKYENLPCVVNEALCCGLPVLSSNVGGIAELVNSTNGLLVEEGNVSALANALYNYLQHASSFDRKAIGENAVAKFNYKAIGNEIADLYKTIVSRY